MRSDDGYIPCSLEEAVTRMLEMEESGRGEYCWGGGHYDPTHPLLMGMTVINGKLGWDCAGAAISQAFRLFRHRPGFNRTSHATVSDDLNVDSILEDADADLRAGQQELGELATVPAPGILLITPTIRLPATEAHGKFEEPGHVRLIVDAAKWNPKAPKWADVTYLECHGPPGHKPGVTRATGVHVDEWDAKWPKPLHKAAMVRIRARP